MAYQYQIITWTEQSPAPGIAHLPQTWQERLRKHALANKRKEAIFAYDLLGKLVAKQLGYLPELAVAEQGKPYFPQESGVYFSVSHTKDGAMVAVATVPIGVDLERIRPISTYTMQRVGHTDTIDAFFQTWVEREAQGKCLGTGISPTGQVLKTEKPLAMQTIEAPQGYKAALAMLV